MTIATDSSPAGFRGWLRRVFGGPSAVYGLILYSALIAGVSDESTDSLEVLIVSFISLIIFFIAHVFAHTLSDHGDHGFWNALEGGVRESAGMLYAAIPSTLVLIAGATTHMDADDSVSLALLVATLVLGVLGYSAYARRGAGRFVRIVGAIGTAILGFAIMILNYAVH
ncbi:MAG: hypothetical protein Q7T17_16975 [Microbacterium sp.]|uniref:hypothetical protein n=1 Tax=Microbacterium sp. TaxID=51671 RepID=UPI002721F954|nr:hypothetical protein [Microbacterium sp.]MDO8384655.1 hypothetical protein [Microbacterium sp.]